MLGADGAQPPSGASSSSAIANSHASLTGAPNIHPRRGRRNGGAVSAPPSGAPMAYHQSRGGTASRLLSARISTCDRPPSVGLALPEDDRHGAQQDLEIKPERPVVDVFQIVADTGAQPLFGRDRPVIAVDLRPAGDARLDVVAHRII